MQNIITLHPLVGVLTRTTSYEMKVNRTPTSFFRLLMAVAMFFVTVQPAFSASLYQNRQFTRFFSENARIERGLSQNTVYVVFQDSHGLLWLGTWDGLNRFDGYEFRHFNRESGLSNETIRSIAQTGDLLWVGTEEGLNAINLRNGNIRNYFASDTDSASLTNNWINHLLVDSHGRLWVSTSAGLNVLDPATGLIRQFFGSNYGNAISSNYFNYLLEDHDGRFWAATRNGLLQFSTGSSQLVRYLHNPANPQTLPHDQVSALALTMDKAIWVGTKAGLARLDAETGRFGLPIALLREEPALAKLEINRLYTEQDSLLWIGTQVAGLYKYNLITQTITRYAHAIDNPNSLSDNRVYDICRDNRGNLWVGTFNGLNRLSTGLPLFRTFRNNPLDDNSLLNNSVWAFEEDAEGRIWIGTEEGISIFDRTRLSFSHIRANPAKRNGLPAGHIREIYRDSRNRMWIGTRYNGLSLYDPATGHYRHYRHLPGDTTSLPDNQVVSLMEDHLGRIWVGTPFGLGRLDDPATEKFRNYRANPANPNALPDRRVLDVFQDAQHRIWLATGDGLALYRPETDDFEVFRATGTTGMNNRLFSIRSDSSGKLWLGTRGGGILVFDPQQKTFVAYTEHDGLTNNVVYLALSDKVGNIWASTNWGLTKFNIRSGVFSAFEVSDGLQSNEFNFNAGLVASDGQLFFGGMNGFTMFYPEDIIQNTQPPKIIVTTYKLLNQLQLRQLFNNDTLRLRYDENFFGFEFAALDFANSNKIKYRFKLENHNDSWVERSSGQRYAEFARVSPGIYRFMVQSTNAEGVWTDNTITIHIIVLPPWYQTWWFRALLILLGIVLFYLFLFFRLRTVRKKHEDEKRYLEYQKKTNELEQKALQLQMNPHFLFNSLNSIQSFVLKNDIDNAIRYLSKFSQLMRRTLNHSKESTIPLQDELEAIRLYLEIEQLRFENKFEFFIDLDPAIDEQFVEIPPMILQPIVENAIHHGLMHRESEGKLLISLRAEGQSIRIVIEDNGIGRVRSAELRRQSGIRRESLGMAITTERFEMLSQYSGQEYTFAVEDLKDQNGNALGTRVIILISPV
ncbi:MAG TPA: two-component regulator propeller domain-containing protein [Bacteroidales bacterium]|nr:two-component regulator propeller domain-containing protein [Bacteroidales bacterium]